MICAGAEKSEGFAAKTAVNALEKAPEFW